MNSDTIYYLTQRLDSVRSESIEIIKEIMENANLETLNVQDLGTGDYPVISNGDDTVALAAVNKDEEGNLTFEFDGEFDSITKGEGDMYADDLLEIAAWFGNNEDDINNLGEEEEEEEEEEEDEEDF